MERNGNWFFWFWFRGAYDSANYNEFFGDFYRQKLAQLVQVSIHDRWKKTVSFQNIVLIEKTGPLLSEFNSCKDTV